METKYKRDSTWGFLAILMIVFILAGIRLNFQQSNLNNIKSDANNVEYLSSSTQRMIMLTLSGQSDQKLIYYLQEQTELFFNVSDSSLSVLKQTKFLDISKQILYHWDTVMDLVNDEVLNPDALILASDNHFYQMTRFTDLINSYYLEVSDEVVKSQYLITFILFVFCIVIGNNFLKYHEELKENKERAKLACIDTSTGLYNRCKCQELFKTKTIPSGHKPAIIVFDLNDLKKTNDTLGHRIGDDLINSFANIIKSASVVHSTTPFLGRYGGDEFIVYYENLNDEKEILAFLKELKYLAYNVNKYETRFQISYAHGYAISNDNQIFTPRELFDLADELMYADKKIIKTDNVDFENTPPMKIDYDTANSNLQIENFFDVNYDENTTDFNARTNKKNFYMISGLLAFVMAFSLVDNFTAYAYTDYIDGNILYLPIGNGYDKLENQAITNPWNKSSISSLITFRSLFYPTADFTDVTPDMCSYLILDDGLTYAITLKEDLFWSDGVPITVDDITFSIESFLLATDTNTDIATAFNKIVGADDWINGTSSSLAGLEVEGNVLTIHLTSNNTSFLQILAQFVPLPKHILSNYDVKTLASKIDYFNNPVCSGMYMVEGMDFDFNLNLVKNPYYNEAESDIEKIVFIWDYFNNTIDYYNTANISQIVSYSAMRGFEEYITNTTNNFPSLIGTNESIYINENRLIIPDGLVFTNTSYRMNLHLEEWSIKKY